MTASGIAEASRLHTNAHVAGAYLRGPLAPAVGAPRVAGTLPEQIRPRTASSPVTFNVNTTTDAPLLNSSSTTCTDNEGVAHCSLRAAVEAANNLNKPVLIKLKANSYPLNDTTDGSLVVTNVGGTSIVGTTITGTRIIGELAYDEPVFQLTEGASNRGATLSLSTMTVQGGQADYGSGITVSGANLALVLDSVTVSHNVATSGGAGLYCYDSSVWISNSTFAYNSATSTSGSSSGGAINDYWCNMSISNTAMYNNSAGSATEPGSGGAIYNEFGSISLSGGSLTSNTAGAASSGDGGAIDTKYGGLTISGTNINNNYAYGYGGGIALDFGRLVDYNSTFANNQAAGTSYGQGGAIAVDGSSANIDLHGATFTHNVARDSYGGGAINYYGTAEGGELSADGCKFTNNNGSAVVFEAYYGGLGATITNSTFENNSAATTYSGAAVSEYDYEDSYGGLDLTLSGDTITHNVASSTWSAGGVMEYSNYGGASLQINNSTISNNTASGGDSTGGVLSYATNYSNSSVNITNSTISANKDTSSGYGGGVFSYGGTTDGSANLSMNNDKITDNQTGAPLSSAPGIGGGIGTFGTSKLLVTNTTVSGNTAIGNASEVAYGGGIGDESDDGAILRGDTITNNHVVGTDGSGGGLYVDPTYATTIVSGSTIGANSAQYGAGLYLYEWGLEINGSTISNNVAGSKSVAGYGAGIYDASGALKVTNSTLSGNDAMDGGSGGAIYFAPTTYSGSSGDPLGDSEVMTLYFDTVAQNYAANGAGIYYAGGAFGTLRDSIVVNNFKAPKSAVQAECFAATAANAIQSVGGNLLSRSTCVSALEPGDVVSSSPGVMALAANGSILETMALLAKSPAVGLAKGDCIASDERGVARKAGKCDSGAYQLTVKGKPV
jgi:CSLREA domain-containing protein